MNVQPTMCGPCRAIALLIGAAAVFHGSSGAQAGTAQVGTARPAPDRSKVIARGMDYLIRSQRPDGSWPQARITPHDPIVETSLAALALLAAGNSTRTGPHRKQLRRAVRFIQRRIPPTGPLRVRRPRPGDWQRFETWYAAFASLCLTEVQRRHPTDLNRDVLKALCRRLLYLRRPTGGWCHDLAPRVRKLRGVVQAEYAEDMVAVSNYATMALLELEQVGIQVPKRARDRLKSYYRKVQNDDGGVKYGLMHTWRPAEKSEPGRTAGALLVLRNLFDEGEAKRRCASATNYLTTHFTQIPFSAGHGGNPFRVSWLAGALGCRAHSAALWRRFDAVFAAQLCRRQAADGSIRLTSDLWSTKAGDTAIALACLLADRDRLVFARSPRCRATQWLLQQRRADGSWFGQWGIGVVDLALTSLAQLALVANGEPEAAAAAREWLRVQILEMQKQGWKTGRRSHLHYQLPYVLAALCGGKVAPSDRAAAKAIVQRLASTQWKTGGWSYDAQELYPLASVTSSVLIGLARARAAGVAVPQRVIDKGLRYLRACANKDLGIRYCIDPRHPLLAKDRERYLRSQASTTLTALSAFAALDKQRDDVFRRGLRFLRPRLGKLLSDRDHRYLHHQLFWAEALRRKLPEKEARRWQGTVADVVLSLQSKDGSIDWPGMAFSRGMGPRPFDRVFATAAALCLEGW